MKITLVGAGNVGAALLFPLANDDAVDRVYVMSRKEESAMIAILDVASAHPVGASKISFYTDESLAQSDLIILAAGLLPKSRSAEETYEKNLQIATKAVGSVPLKNDAIVICLATPVDYVTAEVQRACKLPESQVFGFGGDLDTNRLRYLLAQRGISSSHAYGVGEHGPNVIPVFAGEQKYDDVTHDLRHFWKKIVQHEGVVRNLATAELLGRIVHSIATNSGAFHNVCAYHQDYGVYLTWPMAIGRKGVNHPMQIQPGPRASELLDQLVRERKKRLHHTPVH